MHRVVLLLTSLLLAGCAGPPKPLSDLFTSKTPIVTAVTSTYTNPIGRRELYELQNAYGAALSLALSYRNHCYPNNVAVQPPPIGCANRRTVVQTLQSADRKARAAVVAARNFVRNNPTLSAASAIAAARTAVTDFQAVAATYGVR